MNASDLLKAATLSLETIARKGGISANTLHIYHGSSARGTQRHPSARTWTAIADALAQHAVLLQELSREARTQAALSARDAAPARPAPRHRRSNAAG